MENEWGRLNAKRQFLCRGYYEIHYTSRYVGNKGADTPFIKSQKRQFVNNSVEISNRG